MSKNDGGPAFPCGNTPSEGDGMTLRDYFAAAALQGMLAHSRGNPPHGYRPIMPNQPWHEAISEEAFRLADTMLA